MSWGDPAGFRDLTARTALRAVRGVQRAGLLTAALLRPARRSTCCWRWWPPWSCRSPWWGRLRYGRPAGRSVGWLLLASGVALPLATAADIYAGAAFTRGLPAAQWAGSPHGWPWVPAVVLVPTVGVLLYPDGRLPPRRGCRSWSSTW